MAVIAGPLGLDVYGILNSRIYSSNVGKGLLEQLADGRWWSR